MLCISINDDDGHFGLIKWNAAKLKTMYGLYSTKLVNVDAAFDGKILHHGKSLPITRKDISL